MKRISPVFLAIALCSAAPDASRSAPLEEEHPADAAAPEDAGIPTLTLLRAVAKSLGAGEADLKLGSAATVTAVKQTKLDQYRIIYFATHALVSGETEQAAKG